MRQASHRRTGFGSDLINCFPCFFDKAFISAESQLAITLLIWAIISKKNPENRFILGISDFLKVQKSTLFLLPEPSYEKPSLPPFACTGKRYHLRPGPYRNTSFHQKIIYAARTLFR